MRLVHVQAVGALCALMALGMVASVGAYPYVAVQSIVMPSNSVPDIAIDASNNLWIADYNAGVSEFYRSTGYTTSRSQAVVAQTWGTGPYAVATDSSGNVWAALPDDTGVLELDGTTLATTMQINDPQYVTNPWDVVVANGNVFITDYLNNNATGGAIFSTSNVYQGDMYGNNAGIGRLALDHANNIWCTAAMWNGNYGALELAPDGQTPIRQILYPGTSYFTNVAVDGPGNVWFVGNDDQLYEYSGTGTLLNTIISPGGGFGSFSRLGGIAFDSLGNLLVSDQANSRALRLLQAMPGDANGDGAVNINDLSKVLANYDKTSMTWADGDFSGDGTVNISDLSVILANYDKTFTAGNLHAVPEPSTLLLAVGVMSLLAYARRKQRSTTRSPSL
jgi:hypothetical protein